MGHVTLGRWQTDDGRTDENIKYSHIGHGSDLSIIEQAQLTKCDGVGHDLRNNTHLEFFVSMHSYCSLYFKEKFSTFCFVIYLDIRIEFTKRKL